MEEKITLKKVITVVKLSVFLVWFWPLPQNTSKRKLLYMTLYQLVCAVLTVTVIASMAYGFMKNLDNQDFMMKSALGLFPTSHVIWNIFCHLTIYRRLQYVTFEMENVCALIKPHEEKIIQREYIDKCASFYCFCIVSFYTTIFALLFGPLVLDQPLPAPADFPFDISHQPLRTIMYVHQILVGLIIAAHLSVHVLMALLLWFAIAKFKLLTEDMRRIEDAYDFVKCIVKHQCLLKYAEEITLTVRPFALGTIIFSTTSLVVFGLICIMHVPLLLKIQCVVAACSALAEVFMYTWPAEHLIYMSGDVARTAFEINWCDGSEELRRKLQMVMMRSQKPIVIALPLGLPTLSLQYYGSYLSTIFSYFTTMRIMFEE